MRGETAASGGGRRASKLVTFTGADNLGELDVPTVSVFTVTGQVLIERLVPYCTVDVAGALGTLALGVVGSTSLFLAATTGTDIDAGKFWLDTTPAEVGGFALPAALKDVVVTANVVVTVATADITGGAVRFDVWWRPLGSDGYLSPA